ncbi:hypothetical protein [Malonomonas rubra]|uniref:hypothetical protein n=1 Tax=Malonomonas rubra TaxID=57040 RepID=UPI0026ECD352|nr:hypothetical protein [Malonomonas rubra]
MKKLVLFGLLSLCLLGTAAAEEGSFVKYQQILDEKCSQCHTRLRIEEASKQGADLDAIIDKMIRMGAKLDEQDRKVMGVFWGREKEEKSAMAEAAPDETDPLREYRAVVQSRCTGCHSLEIVEKAMAEGRSINALIDMMRQRGAIITEADQKVLGTFWGNPLKENPE